MGEELAIQTPNNGPNNNKKHLFFKSPFFANT
jgi:hypothetical protein